jgi:plasmid stability protein
MATVTIRNLDDGVRDRIRVAAARHGRSMEAELRAALEQFYAAEDEKGLGSRIRARFAKVGGIEPEEWLPARDDEPARYADFGQ